MATQATTIHLHMSLEYPRAADGSRNYCAPKTWQPEVWGFRMEDTAERVYVGPREVHIDVPDDFNPVPRQVAALEAERAKAMDDYQRAVARINDQLSKLLAITN